MANRLSPAPHAVRSSRAGYAWPVAGASLALAVGAVTAKSALLAFGAIGLALVVVGAFAAPVVNLVLVVFTTTIVPFGIQNRLGGAARGLIVSDVLLLGGLVRVVPGLLAGVPISRRQRNLLVAIAAFSLLVVVEFIRGVAAGGDPSVAGAELRTLLGFSAFAIAVPLVNDGRSFRHLLKGLLVVGIVLGLWGLAQWIFDIEFEGGFGVREGISGTSGGRGQLQGGLYAFPIAAVLGFAALTSEGLVVRRHRLIVAVMTGLNLICLILTYERTFWVATFFALGFVVLKAGRGPRSRAVLWSCGMAVVLLAGMGTLAPGALGAARERLMSLGQYANDNSVRYRVVESQHVVDAILASPATGSGLGAEIVWSRPWEQVPARSYDYTHNGYLWLAWKVGLPGAVLLVAAVLVAACWRSPRRAEPLVRSIRHGAQGALLLLLVASLTFPAFNTYGITATMGVLLAMCTIGWQPSGDDQSGSDVSSSLRVAG